MILFQNSLFKLDYNPATDIVEIDYPDLHTFLLPEIKHTIELIVDVIKSYDVRKLLLDSSKTVLSVEAHASREISTYLASGITSTRVQKVARLQANLQSVESTARNNISHIQESQKLPFELRSFTDKQEAISWLEGKPVK
ncbi:hypothetical protein H8S95_03280 [Pontibacter sp. KCTC 32443]|uniref:hypothetical protein n=1 Tax=Pontibacter TaxID=323449 RepID=UPI00164E4E06|nr:MULTISPECIES: hypothetical protein [Pontibacter]MBC5773073.1 hypothetical protein [Pontibacter sp. KCTC 32443]